MKTCEQGALSREAEWAHAPHQHAAPLLDQWCMKLRPGSCNRHIHLMQQFVKRMLNSCIIQWNPSRATPSRAATPLVRPYFQAPLYFSYISFKCQPLMNSHPTNLVRGQWFWFQPPLTSSHSAAARSGQPWNSWLIWLWAHRHTHLWTALVTQTQSLQRCWSHLRKSPSSQGWQSYSDSSVELHPSSLHSMGSGHHNNVKRYLSQIQLV